MDGEAGELPGKPERPAITRLWVAVQKIGRVRDEYTRAQDPLKVHAAARGMLELADEIRALAGEIHDDSARKLEQARTAA